MNEILKLFINFFFIDYRLLLEILKQGPNVTEIQFSQYAIERLFVKKKKASTSKSQVETVIIPSIDYYPRIVAGIY